MHTPSHSPSLKPSTPDRRADRRREIDVLMNRFLNGHPFLCRASDISRTGMRIHPISGSSASTRFVGLQFQLPGCSDVITASGEVVTEDHRESAVGVRFTRLPPASADRIGRFLAASRPA
jgi:c-di-GMP-binding flagellar brake protein YcgR